MRIQSELLDIFGRTAAAKPTPIPISQGCQLNISFTPLDATVTFIPDTGSQISIQPLNGRGGINVPAGVTGGASIQISCSGYKTINHRLTTAAGLEIPIPLSGAIELQSETLIPIFTRPLPTIQLALPPFDASDSGGDVHTTQPPDLVIPAGFDINFWRGDIGGVTLPVSQTPQIIPGVSNTTPSNMTMSFVLPYYNSKDRDNVLTAHAQRYYSHFHLDQYNWQTAGLSIQQAVSLFQYVQSWGFFTSYWALGTKLTASGWNDAYPIILPFLNTLIAQTDPTKSIIVIGEELNSYTTPGSPGLDDIITQVSAICKPVGMKTAVHFTSNYPGWPAPGTSVSQWYADMAGKIDFVLWQSNPTDPAGTMGAHMWDTRKYVGFNSKVVAFELRAEQQLLGQCTEEQGCLTGLELLYCTSDGSAGPVAGFGNGARLPNGLWI